MVSIVGGSVRAPSKSIGFPLCRTVEDVPSRAVLILVKAYHHIANNEAFALQESPAGMSCTVPLVRCKPLLISVDIN